MDCTMCNGTGISSTGLVDSDCSTCKGLGEIYSDDDFYLDDDEDFEDM